MLRPHDRYNDRDTTDHLDGDSAFTGMDMRIAPDLLPKGRYSFARNMRLEGGKPTTRRGAVYMAWSQAGTPNTTGVFASLAFQSPTGINYLLKARANHCEACTPTAGVQTIAYPAGVTIDSECELIQAFDRVLLLRGAAYPVLVWSPASNWVDPFSQAFTGVTLSSGGSGVNPIPQAGWGYLFKNRLVVPLNRDELAVSDVLDYTRYDPVSQQFKVNKGDAESVRGVVAGGKDTLVVFKEQSIYTISSFVGDLSETVLDQLPVDIGLGARRSIVRYGTDVIFLGGDRALYSLTQALDNQLQGDERSFSQEIEPIMRGIQPALAEKTIGVIWGKKLYLAIGVDGGKAWPTVIAVYDFTAGAWVSIDTSGLYEIQNLIVMPYQGVLRLFLVQASGACYLLEEGYDDAGQPIATEWVSRGYTCDLECHKNFQRAEVVLSTWAPNYTISEMVDGGSV